MGAFDSKDYDEIVTSFGYFGLEKIDAVIYLTLLDSGPSTMSELATKLEVDRGRIYRAMEKLVDIGVVKLHSAKVTTCEAIKPETAFMMLIEKKKTKVTELRKISKDLIPQLQQFTRKPEEVKSPSISMIEGRNSIYTRIGKLIQDSVNPVYFVTTTDDFVRMCQTAIPEKIKTANSKGLRIRIVVDAENSELKNLNKSLKLPEIRFGKLPSKSRIIVEKESQLIMSGMIKDSSSLTDESESVMYTNSPEMTDNMYSLCEQIWKKTKPILISNS